MDQRSATGGVSGERSSSHQAPDRTPGKSPPVSKPRLANLSSPHLLGSPALNPPPRPQNLTATAPAESGQANAVQRQATTVETKNIERSPSDSWGSLLRSSEEEAAEAEGANGTQYRTESDGDSEDESWAPTAEEFREQHEAATAELIESKPDVKKMIQTGEAKLIGELKHEVIAVAHPTAATTVNKGKSAKGKGGKGSGAASNAFRIALSDLVSGWNPKGTITAMEVKKILPQITDNTPPGAVWVISVTQKDHKLNILRKGTKYTRPISTFSVNFIDADDFRTDKKEQEEFTRFELGAIAYTRPDGTEVALDLPQMAACCEIAGMLPEMYTLENAYFYNNNNEKILTKKFFLNVKTCFTEFYGATEQSGELYTIQKGIDKGKEICKPEHKIYFPPRSIAFIDENGGTHTRQPYLPGACKCCLSFEHKERLGKKNSKCIYTNFCRTCLCYLPDCKDGKGLKHACTAGIECAETFKSSNMGGGKGKGKVKMTEDQKAILKRAQQAIAEKAEARNEAIRKRKAAKVNTIFEPCVKTIIGLTFLLVCYADGEEGYQGPEEWLRGLATRARGYEPGNGGVSRRRRATRERGEPTISTLGRFSSLIKYIFDPLDKVFKDA